MKRQATPEMRDLAGRLIAHETAGKSAARTLAGGLLVCDRLRPHLATIIGTIGFKALLSRALALAAAEIPSLGALHIEADGSFEPLEEPAAPVGKDKGADGGVVLVAHLLGLLVTFIGEDLTLRLVREIWPKMAVDKLALG